MKYKILRVLIQWIAVGIFILQMKLALEKYINNPVVSHMSQATLADIEMPELYICSMNQYKYSLANTYGYAWNSNFLSGQLTCKNCTKEITWKGANQSMKYEKLITDLYEFNYTDLNIQKPEETNIDDVFILPEGFCKKVDIKGTDNIQFETTNKMSAILVDSFKANRVRKDMEGVIGERMNVQPTTPPYFEFKTYKVKLTKLDKRVLAGKTCTDYSAQGTTKATCFEQAIKDTFLDHLDCLPPWFQILDNDMTCNKNIVPKPETASYLYNMSYHLLANLPIDVAANKCLPSCTEIQINIEKIFHRSNIKDAAIMEIIIDKKVPVYTFIFSYGIFDLVVEVGSALGLWLGLSAIGIFDELAQIARLMLRISKFGSC